MLLVLLFFILSPAQADFSNSVLDGCEKLTHSEWLKHYDETENLVIDAFEKDPKLSQTSADRDFFEVVYPQDLPKVHPMRGAFSSCFSFFEKYQKAINNVQSMPARKKLEECYARAYRKNPPKVVARYMDCLKRIKY